MKVYLATEEGYRLIGRAEIPADCGPVHREYLFGALSTVVEEFAIGSVASLDSTGTVRVDRGVLLSPLQRPEVLPGWTPLSS